VIGWTERAVFSPRHAEAYRLARALVGRVSSHLDREGREVRCHELARAVVHYLGIQEIEARVVDGVLWSIEHTWIVLPGQYGNDALLDVYAPGRLPQVQLIDTHGQIMRGYEPWPVSRSAVRDEVVDDLIREMAIARLLVEPRRATASVDGEPRS